MSSRKLPVAINVFPTLDYIEVVKFDEKNGEIEKAASLPFAVDQVNRQIEDVEALANTIRDLYNTNRIPLNTPAILVIPSFFTREIELPAEFSKDELRFALISETERFYMFKKVEPQIDWINLDEARLLYSAFPKPEIEKYMGVFNDLKIPLLAIDLSYFSIMRGLVATGTLTEEISQNAKWCLMVISDATFFAAIQQGIHIIKSIDTPLSVSDDDASASLSEIQQDFDTFCELENFDKLIVVNNSTRINAEQLVSCINFQGPVIIIEQSGLNLRSRGAVNGQFPCSLEAIGGVFYQQLPELPNLNFIPRTGTDAGQIVALRQQALKILIVLNVAAFLLCLVVWGAMKLLVWTKDQEIQGLTRQAASLGAVQNAQQYEDMQRRLFAKKVLNENIKSNNLIVKLATLLPQDTWLEKISMEIDQNTSTEKVNIEGKSLKPEPVSSFENDLNKALNRQDLEVQKVDQGTSQDGQTFYAWQISNQAPSPAAGAPPP